MAKAKKQKKALSPYNRHVQREMKAGKSMKQAAASWSKSSGKPKAASRIRAYTKRSNSTPKGGKSRMGKKNGFNTQKIFKYVRLGALALPAASTIATSGLSVTSLNKIKSDYFGIWSDGSFHWESLAKGWMPFAAATLLTYGIPKATSILRGM